MDLILWRHAEAEEGGADLERKLTRKGHKHAARIAQWLLQRLPSKFAVFASPARRAQQTADALGLPYRTVDEIAPGASARAVLDAAGWPERKGAVVLVGHQPSLGRAAARAVSGSEQEWTIKKSGLWWLTFRDRDERPQVVVRAVVAPDLL